MNISTDTQTKTENQLLRAWYEDSLSLIFSDTVSVAVDASETELQSWRNTIGILTLTGEGKELWSQGDTKACYDFLARYNVSELSGEAFNVEPFNDGLILLSSVRNVVRIVYANNAAMIKILRDAAPDAELSNAELRLLLQILSGLTLRSSAKLDGVSYETKRSQFKSLAMRTGFRTQSEVIRVSLLALTAHALDQAGTQSSENDTGMNTDQEFLNFFYPNTFRYHGITTGLKRHLRVIETGPISGTPIIYIHSQTLPPPSQFNLEWLEANNIRLIIPLRSGLLDPDAERASLTKHRDRATEDLYDTIVLFCGGKCRIIASSTGSVYAINLARKHPETISQLTIFAAAYLGRYNNKLVERLVSGMNHIASRSNLILEKIYGRYVKKMSTIEGVRTVIESAYKSSPADMNTFKDVLASPLGHRWMYDSYRLSRWSIVSDVMMPNLDVWNDVENIQTPILFVHGAQDPVNASSDANVICQRFPNSRFVELKEEAQSIFRHRLEEMISRDSNDWHDQQR